MRYSALLLALCSAGCMMRVGPKTIQADRFQYSTVITDSLKSQMLLNLVRMRYLDSPMFMDVAQVVTQYSFEASGEVTTPDWSTGVYYPGATASGRWAESPTITYNPVTGDKFTKSLLQPISPVSLFQLVQAGWPIDSVFAIGARSINGLHAVSNLGMMKRAADPNYYRALKLMRELQLDDAFGLRVEPQGAAKEGEEAAGGEAPEVYFFPGKEDSANRAKADEVKKLLGLTSEESRFKIAFGNVQKDDKEIAMLTRSILEILGEAAAGVEIPEADLKEGRATSIPLPDFTTLGFTPLIVRVHSAEKRPTGIDVFAVTQYHGRWFYIDHRDLGSKRGLGFLLVLSTLAESGTSISPPVLTISKP